MQNPLPLTDDGEVRELSEEDFINAVPFSALSESLQTTLLSLKGRGKQQAPPKYPPPCVLTARCLMLSVPPGRVGKPA